MTEDLSVFFETDDFAIAATYDGATAVDVIFDNDFLRSLGMVTTSDPTALGKAADFPAAAVTKSLVISGVTYTIRDRQLVDDGALVLLQLEAA